jgi:2-keto-4-pentenoate hydratase
MEKAKIAAKALIEARNTNQPLLSFPENSAPKTVKDAFAIQDAILVSTGADIAAWKVGPGSDHFPPTCAPITRENVFFSPGKLSASRRLKAVECEVAFRLGMDFPANGGPYNAADAQAAVATVMVSIEAVETRYNGWPVEDPFWALADSQSNEALILGSEVELEKVLNLFDLKATLSIGGLKKDADKGFPGGDPFALIAWLAVHLGSRDPFIAQRGLKKGDVVTTGSWNGVDFSETGSLVTAVFDGLGEASLIYS